MFLQYHRFHVFYVIKLVHYHNHIMELKGGGGGNSEHSDSNSPLPLSSTSSVISNTVPMKHDLPSAGSVCKIEPPIWSSYDQSSTSHHHRYLYPTVAYHSTYQHQFEAAMRAPYGSSESVFSHTHPYHHQNSTVNNTSFFNTFPYTQTNNFVGTTPYYSSSYGLPLTSQAS